MCGTGTVRVCVRVTSQVKSTGLWTGTRCFGRRNLLRFVLSRATYPHPRVKIATRARPTYLPSPSRRAWSPGPTYLPLATLEKGCNISATKAWVSEGPSSIVGFSGDRSCPFMSIFGLENRILCLDGLDIFSELQGSSGSQRSMRMHAESMDVCTFSASDLPTYPRCRAATSRPDLPTYPLRLSRGWTYLV